MSDRLTAASAFTVPGVETPGYAPEQHAVGIVHLGLGAFHKAHQAVYTDAALAAEGGDWRILGVSLRSPDAAAAMNPQDGRYTLLVRGEDGPKARIVGSVSQVLVAPHSPETVIEAIARPQTRIVTLTVTEKAYGLDPATGGLDAAHEAVAKDLAAPESPHGVVGFLVAGLARRAGNGAGPLTLVSCDNLPHNGGVLKRLVLEFAGQVRPEITSWIEANVAFPSTMVDRITPAATERTLADAKALTGFDDAAAIETEPFTQWVVEDDFAAGRPAWEAGGAIFVDDVAPFEMMKLRMLNGAHSLIAYAGFAAGYETVSQAMEDEALVRLVERQMRAAAASLPPMPGIDLDAYHADLLARFRNPSIRHLTYQIAMDGTQKLPPRIFAPLGEGVEPAPFAFVLAAWMRYALGLHEDGATYALRDPREGEIAARLAGVPREAGAIFEALATLPGWMPAVVSGNAAFREGVVAHLRSILADGMRTAVRRAV
ncbi:mannitol dehydrogenase family protein [Aureimonas mangrovi]|uniref:mannitol dehydrogenase family protein n=1 Tax=Aureimonas mangrovi TaxID=2758041 RepID=UPI001FEC1845|nr:mannitol dehydrogenase family protein [Aureimonas mangrovi]